MARIIGVGTALPGNFYNKADIQNIGRRWLEGRNTSLELFQRFVSSAQNDARYFSVDAEEILSLNGLQHRADLFEREAPLLGARSLGQAISKAGIAPSEISSFLFTSCSLPSIPAVDALIIEKSGMPRTVRRLPIYQHGCAGGVIGLGLAHQLTNGSGPVALTSVELCSLVFHNNDDSPAQLVGAAIFGDGSASVIVDERKDGLQIVAVESFLVPNSRHLMGYDTFDDGFHLRLDRQLPGELAAAAPQRVVSFLKAHNLKVEDVSYWLFHPGGVKILDSLERSLSIEPARARWAREVLSEIGNLSSATVLFVLERFLDSGTVSDGDKVVMLGVGPGLTIELILMEYLGS
ncbi:MAG: hypothetical protein J5J00_06060 [Deltaproteobacteria bacterium]|nr:hypothetical protein [Deltaproteobacteria bacterium]